MRIKRQILLFFAAILVFLVLFYFSQQKQSRNDNLIVNFDRHFLIKEIEKNVTTTRYEFNRVFCFVHRPKWLIGF